MQKTNNNSNSFFLFVTLLTLQVAFGNCVYGQVLRPGDDMGAIRPPYSEEMDQSNITERLGDLLPLDLEFMDHTGAKVKLADFFSGDLPVLLTPVYYRCPQLCTLVLNGMVDSLDKIELQPGRDYRILSFTFADGEEFPLAEAKREAYLTRFPAAEVEGAWSFLAGVQGDAESAEILCKSVGFGYAFHEPSGEYVHPACVVFVSPSGTITRYMNDVAFAPVDMNLSIVETGDGKIGTALDKFLLFTCFAYSGENSGYSVSVMKLMRTAALLTVAALTVSAILQLRFSRTNPQPTA
ncbi:MAG: hypothetical protein CMC97_05295 [Flavobacteriales bacterium]|nr:hypothetical protein [Flavobacteriales bacterium]